MPLRAAMLASVALAMTGAMTGCAPEKLSPVEWWHSLEGGRIADERPPPPQADAPYPNLSTVPARPPAPDPAPRAVVSGGLVADRTNAQYAASLAPLPAAPAPPPKPVQPPPLPTGDEIAGASLPAASAPPPPKPAPVKAPPVPAEPAVAPRSVSQPVEQAALSPPAPAASAAAASAKVGTPAPAPAPVSMPDPPAEPPKPAVIASAPALPPAAAKPAAPVLPSNPAAGVTPAAPLASLPPIPAAPPPPPVLPGVSSVTIPTPAPPTPPAPPPPPPPTPSGAPIVVGFPPGSSVLPVESLAPLKVLARQRGAANIVVVGYGDAVSTDAAAQASAVPLALARARAIATNLLAAGVPGAFIHITAEAQGHGGAAHLTN